MPVDLGANTTLSGEQRYIERDLDLLVALGFRWARTSQEMHWGGGSTGAYALGVLERYVDACKVRGLRLVQCCQGMPAAFARGGIAGHYAAKDAASARKWGAWVGECAALVDEVNGATTIGNEWNGYGWGLNGSPKPNIADAATLHVAAVQGRNDKAPTAILGTCEMMPGDSPDPLLFLQSIVGSLLSQPRMTIGWHPYVDPRWPADEPERWNACYRMVEVDAWLEAQGHPRMKIIGGEWGIANGPAGNPRALSPMQTATYVAHSYLPTFDNMQAAGVRLTAMCWYALRDFKPPIDPRADSWANYCGIVDLRGNRKPVAAVLQAYNEGTL